MDILNVAPDLCQAFWRLALNGNPYWFFYTKHSKVTLGRVASTGNDFTPYAGLPYHLTPEVVDQHQLGFGLYSRSSDGKVRWAGFDIEPLHEGHPIQNPSSEQEAVAEGEAQRLYRAWVKLARDEQLVLWVLLVRSSPGRHHVWAVFDQPVDQQAHNDLAKRVLKSVGPMQHLDASTLKCRRGLGCPLRAPWCWKAGRRSEVVHMWLRDEKRALRLAARTVPDPQPEDPLGAILLLIEKGPRPASKQPTAANPSAGWWSQRIKQGPSKKLLDDLFKELVRRYPITDYGQRDSLIPRIILFLFNCGLMPGDIVKVGQRWLVYFERNYRMPLAQAQRELVRCVNRTERKFFYGKLSRARNTFDYDEFFKKTTLLPAEERLVEGILALAAGLSASSYPCHPFPGKGMTGIGKRQAPHFRSVPRTFMECVVLRMRLRLQKGKEEGELLVDWTNRQMTAAVRARCGLVLDCQQLHRLKKKFISFLGKGGRWHNAQQVEVLREVRKGFREPNRPGGLPSLYLPAPVLLKIIGEGESRLDDQDFHRKSKEAELTGQAAAERLDLEVSVWSEESDEIDGWPRQSEVLEVDEGDLSEPDWDESDWDEIDFWLNYQAVLEKSEDADDLF